MKKLAIVFVVVAMFFGINLPLTTHEVQAASSSNNIDQARIAEFEIMLDYMDALPKLPKKTLKDKKEEARLMLQLNNMANANTFREAIPYMTNKSIEMFGRTPLFVSDADQGSSSSTTNDNPVGKVATKIYKGATYASMKYKVKNEKGKKVSRTVYFAKENGVWKIDMIQSLKTEIEKSLK